jgi:hypothetical protein
MDCSDVYHKIYEVRQQNSTAARQQIKSKISLVQKAIVVRIRLPFPKEIRNDRSILLLLQNAYLMFIISVASVQVFSRIPKQFGAAPARFLGSGFSGELTTNKESQLLTPITNH